MSSFERSPSPNHWFFLGPGKHIIDTNCDEKDWARKVAGNIATPLELQLFATKVQEDSKYKDYISSLVDEQKRVGVVAGRLNCALDRANNYEQLPPDGSPLVEGDHPPPRAIPPFDEPNVTVTFEQTDKTSPPIHRLYINGKLEKVYKGEEEAKELFPEGHPWGRRQHLTSPIASSSTGPSSFEPIRRETPGKSPLHSISMAHSSLSPGGNTKSLGRASDEPSSFASQNAAGGQPGHGDGQSALETEQRGGSTRSGSGDNGSHGPDPSERRSQSLEPPPRSANKSNSSTSSDGTEGPGKEVKRPGRQGQPRRSLGESEVSEGAPQHDTGPLPLSSRAAPEPPRGAANPSPTSFADTSLRPPQTGPRARSSQTAPPGRSGEATKIGSPVPSSRGTSRDSSLRSQRGKSRRSRPGSPRSRVPLPPVQQGASAGSPTASSRERVPVSRSRSRQSGPRPPESLQDKIVPFPSSLGATSTLGKNPAGNVAERVFQAGREADFKAEEARKAAQRKQRAIRENATPSRGRALRSLVTNCTCCFNPNGDHKCCPSKSRKSNIETPPRPTRSSGGNGTA